MLLKTLSELNATSGAESPVRNYLRQQVEPYVNTVTTDKMGNLIAVKNNRQPSLKVLLSAHMDEVALMIVDFTNDGFLKFRPVGGIDTRILISKPVQIKNNIGVIGAKAIHLQQPSERQRSLSFDQLYIDIGAKSKEDAASKVQLGDYAYFMTKCEPFGGGLIKGKALDDRAGCALLVELLKHDYEELSLVAAFTVQEEIGLRGAKVAAYHIAPDFAIVLKGTTAADICDQEEDWLTEVGKGPACSLIDQTTLYASQYVRWVTALARKKRIPLQFRRSADGGNDAGPIHISKAGVPTLTLSIPCRYIRSYASVISKKDYADCLHLVDELLKELPRKLRDDRMDKGD